MPIYKLKVVKRPLAERPPDIKPNFGRLGNLHLELLENKKKIKPGLPLIPLRREIVKSRPSPKPSPSPPPREKSPEPSRDDDRKLEEALIKELGASDDERGYSDDERDQRDKDTYERKDTHERDQYDERSEKYASDDEKDYPNENEPPKYQEPEQTLEEREEEERQEYLVKFRILKKQYKTQEFPLYTEHTDLPTLKRLYNDTLRMITLDENVNNYRMFLMGGFLGIEMLAVKAGLDFKGFAKFQFKKMEKYERLLVELGEKSYSNFANNWPVEIRLLGVILMDAGIFYLGKMVSDHAGDRIAEMFSMFFGMPPTQKQEKKKSRMRGPSMRPEDIRNMAKTD